MKSQYSYLRIPESTLEKLHFIQGHISDPVCKVEVLNALLDMGIRIVTSDSRRTLEEHLESKARNLVDL